MTTELRVRTIKPSDYVSWRPLWDGYNAFYGRAGDTTLPEAVTQTTWARFFDPNEPVHGLVAEAGGRLLGIAHYLFHRSTTMIEPTCYLQDLYAAEDARGKGVGRALIGGVYEKAAAHGASRVYWQTHETNVTARRLYDVVADRSGFIVYRKLLQ